MENSKDLDYPFYNHIDQEKYRKNLWEIVNGEYVNLITVRPIKYRKTAPAESPHPDEKRDQNGPVRPAES